MYEAYKDMSRAVGVKKPQEAQTAEAHWKMKAAKEAGEEYYDPTREDNIKGRNETRSALLGRTPQKSHCCVGPSPKVCGKLAVEVSARVLWEGSVLHWVLLASSKVCRKSRSGRAFGLA